MDKLTPGQRSKIMASVKSKDTRPELLIRKLLWGMGYRYRLHRKDLPGKPDLVFPGKRKIIFIHGCFWHNHGCKKAKVPKSNVEFWQNKMITNQKRDTVNITALRAAGWQVQVVWQCELSVKDREKLLTKLVDFLED